MVDSRVLRHPGGSHADSHGDGDSSALAIDEARASIGLIENDDRHYGDRIAM